MMRAGVLYKSDDNAGFVRLIDPILRRELHDFNFFFWDIQSSSRDAPHHALFDMRYGHDQVLLVIDPNNTFFRDFLYSEFIRVARAEGIPIFALLLRDGRVSTTGQLPDDLAELQPDFVQAIRYDSFYDDMGALIQRLKTLASSEA